MLSFMNKRSVFLCHWKLSSRKVAPLRLRPELKFPFSKFFCWLFSFAPHTAATLCMMHADAVPVVGYITRKNNAICKVPLLCNAVIKKAFQIQLAPPLFTSCSWQRQIYLTLKKSDYYCRRGKTPVHPYKKC